MRALGRKDVERALELFREVDSSFQDQPDVAERARAYEGMCLRVREREKRPHKPKGFEDILGNGVVLLNRGEYAEAVKAFHNAAEIHPRNEHVQYCLAAANARVGDLQRRGEGPALGDPCESREPRPGAVGSGLRDTSRARGLRGVAGTLGIRLTVCGPRVAGRSGPPC